MDPTPAPDVAALYGRTELVAFECTTDDEPGGLHPTEEGLATAMGPLRRLEFAAGRRCARAGLAALGMDPDQPIPTAGDRSPAWPAGAIGSISHAAGYCIAVVGRQADFDGASRRRIGVDVERAGRVADRLHRKLFTPTEQAWIDALDPSIRSRSATEVFSAKEAFYKAQHQLTTAWVGFLEVEALREPDGLSLHRAGGGVALDALEWPQSVRSLERGGLILTAVEVRSR